MNNELSTTDLTLLDNGGDGRLPPQPQPTPGAPNAAWSWAVVEDMASRFTCSNSIARDFAGRCSERISDLDFDLLCSELGLDFWANPPDTAPPVTAVLRELETECRRHMKALGGLRDRLLELTRSAAPHQYLELPIEYCRERVRRRLFPDLAPRAVHNHAASGDH